MRRSHDVCNNGVCSCAPAWSSQCLSGDGGSSTATSSLNAKPHLVLQSEKNSMYFLTCTILF